MHLWGGVTFLTNVLASGGGCGLGPSVVLWLGVQFRLSVQPVRGCGSLGLEDFLGGVFPSGACQRSSQGGVPFWCLLSEGFPGGVFPSGACLRGSQGGSFPSGACLRISRGGCSLLVPGLEDFLSGVLSSGACLRSSQGGCSLLVPV